MTPSQIRRAIADTERQISRLDRERETLAAQLLQLNAMLAATESRLHSVNTGSIVDSGMETEHRLAIAKSRSSAGDAKFVAACQKAKHNATTLAAAAGVSKFAFSRYRTGSRKTPLAVRRVVHELIGWPEASWPKLGE